MQYTTFTGRSGIKMYSNMDKEFLKVLRDRFSNQSTELLLLNYFESYTQDNSNYKIDLISNRNNGGMHTAVYDEENTVLSCFVQGNKLPPITSCTDIPYFRNYFNLYRVDKGQYLLFRDIKKVIHGPLAILFDPITMPNKIQTCGSAHIFKYKGK